MWAERREYSSGDQIGQELMRLNADALTARYNDRDAQDEAHEHREASLSYRWPFMSYAITNWSTLAQRCDVYKALRCLRYQCTEGDLPETSELYARMTAAANELAHLIVSDLPEYAKAPWDDVSIAA